MLLLGLVRVMGSSPVVSVKVASEVVLLEGFANAAKIPRHHQVLPVVQGTRNQGKYSLFLLCWIESGWRLAVCSLRHWLRALTRS
jgi:hypothetical protein